MNNRYRNTALSLYLNYFVNGIQAIILAQNIDAYAKMWQTTQAGVMGVIAVIGIGKFIVLLFSGFLSDKFGRKPMALIGMLGYLLFFGLLLISTDIKIVYFIAFIAGAAGSFLDGATYPALMEIFPRNPSAASVVVKGFISAAGILLPIFVGWLVRHDFWFGWSALIAFVITVLNIIWMWTLKFPDQEKVSLKDKKTQATILQTQQEQITAAEAKFKKKPRYAFEGVLLMIYAFFCMGTFYLFQQVITLYGRDIVHLSDMGSRMLMSYYNMGSFAAVIISSFIMTRGIRDMTLLLTYTGISTATLATIYLFPNNLVLSVGSFVVGFTAAGGVLQMGNALLSEFFPVGKGKNTSLYNIFMSIASYIMPALASLLMTHDFTKVMLLDTLVALGGFVIMLVLAKQYKKIFGVQKLFQKRFKEK